MENNNSITSITSDQFQRNYNWLIVSAWMIPALFGLAFIVFIEVLSTEQILGILVTPSEPAFIFASLLIARWYLARYIKPVREYLDSPSKAHELLAIECIRGFPIRFWSLFLFYLVLAPASVILSAEYFTDFVAQPVDWFRIHLVALIVSIIVGLPIFFMMFDLFGRVCSTVSLTKPYVTVKTKVFLIGALVPLLIDTMLVQYYWTRTDYFSAETFFVWLFLEVLAVVGSLLFLKSFQQSLLPLQQLMQAHDNSKGISENNISSLSTDELGIIVKDYLELLDKEHVHNEMLELNNRILRKMAESQTYAEILEYIIHTCQEALDDDMIFILLHDAVTDELVGLVQTGDDYKEGGHYRIPVNERSLAVWVYKNSKTAVVEDVKNDPRVSRVMIERFNVKSTLAVPLMIEGDVLGVVMSIRQKEHYRYSKQEVMFLEGVSRDIAYVVRAEYIKNAHREAENKIRHMAHHDALTGLTNRYEFEKRLTHLLKNRETDDQHALLYVDLDQFKIINDTSGHTAGDELLRQLSLVLKKQIRENDTLARLGGDEFGVLLENCPLGNAERIAESLLNTVKNFHFSWQDKTFSIGASIGMVLIDQQYQNVVDVLSAADVACYTAKDLGRNRVYRFHHEDADVANRKNEMEWVSRIQAAIKHDEFVLFRQDIVPLAENANQCKHFEFLVRMTNDGDEMVSPGAFIPAAERYNLMPEIDRWVIRHAFEYITKCEVKPECEFVVFINLSATSINEQGLATFINEQLKQYSISPSSVCFEITETAAISSFTAALTFIEEIRELGFKFALDDFGAGMSSFSYLKAFPVDFIKIEGEFILNMVSDPMNHAIVEAINNIAHKAGLKTIGEYAENETLIQALRDIGVDYVQGYAIKAPERIT